MHRNGVTRMRQMHKIQQKVERWGTHNYKMQMLRLKEMQKDDATKGKTDWLVGWKKVMEGN